MLVLEYERGNTCCEQPEVNASAMKIAVQQRGNNS